MSDYRKALSVGIVSFLFTLVLLFPVAAGADQLASGVVSGSGDKYSGSQNWNSHFNSVKNWYEITINGEDYYYHDYATAVTPAFATGDKGFCTTNSVDDKLLAQCFDKSGNPVVPVSFSFVTYKDPCRDALACGVVSSSGNKYSGSQNWGSSYNSVKNWYEITINGENYYYHDYATAVTPAFATGDKGFCTTNSVDDKLLVQCFDKSGNPVMPVSFSFVTYKDPCKDALACGVVSGSGNKYSGSQNWGSSFNSVKNWYEITINGENYHYTDYATAVTPAFATGDKGFCTTSSADDKLLVQCFDKSGNPVVPVSFSFLSFKQSLQTQNNLGVYSLCQYENDWKPYICLQQEFDPYYEFWDTMNVGPGIPNTSGRFQNNDVTLKRVIPITGGTEKSWDDFDLVFFYGHNNTIVPPQPHEMFNYYNYEYNAQLGSNTWVSKNGYLDDIGWGYKTNYDYYCVRPINNANQYPGAVTYLYNQYTSSLIGSGYDYGGGVYWHERWNDPILYNMSGRLGDKNLKWLILHGCQAVIASNMDGSYNPLAYNIFSGVHGKYHIILGHYKSYYTSDLQKPLAEFANDLIAGVPIQHAYFDFDPDKNTSAIAAEKWSASGVVDWPNSTMLNDKWNGALSDNVGTNTFSIKWIMPNGADGQAVQKMMVTDSIDLRKVKIESKEVRNLLNSEFISFRAGKTSFIPKGELPVLKLENVDDSLCKKRIQEVMQGHQSKESPAGEVQDIDGMFLSKTDSASCWIHRASGSYKFTQTKEKSSVRRVKSFDYDTAVQAALDYVAKQKLVNLVPREEMDILFASGVKNAVAISKEEKPVEEFMSDYYVGFGRRFNGVPIIGSKLVIRFNGNGDVVMVNKNWRQIQRIRDQKTNTDKKSVVSNKTLLELIISDPSFQSRHGSAVTNQKTKQKTLNPKDIELVEARCGYMEAPVNYIQDSLRPGCDVSYSIGNEKGETFPQIVLPIEEGGSLQKVWGVKYKVKP